MRALFSAALAVGLFVGASALCADKTLSKLDSPIVTTDDCFAAYSSDSSHCALGMCLGRVSGTNDEAVAVEYAACLKASTDSSRAVAADGKPGSDAQKKP